MAIANDKFTSSTSLYLYLPGICLDSMSVRVRIYMALTMNTKEKTRASKKETIPAHKLVV